ncbi:hypothetical protein [Pseudonocardia sp. NPDC046786]|uniref:hypothetical protein n=1 Tax=Pseudonocardia sp. NPDC046786 TaxID=3155471 RepID=UPI0033F6AE8D
MPIPRSSAGHRADPGLGDELGSGGEQGRAGARLVGYLPMATRFLLTGAPAPAGVELQLLPLAPLAALRSRDLLEQEPSQVVVSSASSKTGLALGCLLRVGSVRTVGLTGAGPGGATLGRLLAEARAILVGWAATWMSLRTTDGLDAARADWQRVAHGGPPGPGAVVVRP